LARVTNSLPGGATYQTDPEDLKISMALHWLQLTDEALAKEGFAGEAAKTERTRRFREWVATNTLPNTFETPRDGKPVLDARFTTSLLDGGLLSRVIQQGYDGQWLLKLSGVGQPKVSNNGVSVNLMTDQTDANNLSYRTVRLTQGGLVHLRSYAGCTFDYRLVAPAQLLGLDWPTSQKPEEATTTFRSNVNGSHEYTENNYRTSTFLGRSVSSTDWKLQVFSAPPEIGLVAMDLQSLTDIELRFSTTRASREPGKPRPTDCARIDW